MGIIKHRCVCDICSCGKHACNAAAHANTVGKLRLQNQGDIYVAPSAAYQFPDSLNLFVGGQDLNTIVNSDYKGHEQKGLVRHHPKDSILIPNAKMSSDTITLGDYQAPDEPITVIAEEVEAVQAAPGLSATRLPSYKMDGSTSYGQHFPEKTAARSMPKIYKEEIPPATGELDFNTLNKNDYTKFEYGRPVINKIKDNNIFDMDQAVLSIKPNKDASTGYVPVSALTTNRQHFPGHKPERLRDAKEAKKEGLASDIKFGPDDGKSKISTYGGSFTGAVPKLRNSKRRGTAVNFGTEFTKDTSYGTSYEGKKVGPSTPIKISDSLNLFEGAQDNNTIVRQDFQSKRNIDIERKKPKDQIELPNDKMSKDTITLGTYQPPKVEVSKWGTVKSTPEEQAGERKEFDLEALPRYTMQGNTSYGEHFPKKQVDRVKAKSYKDEIGPAVGELDLNTLNKVDYTATKYGRPVINKIPDNNVFGINLSTKVMDKPVSVMLVEEDVDMDDMDGLRVSRGSIRSVQAAPMGIDLKVESLPSSRGSIGITVDAFDVETKQAVPGYIKFGDQTTTKVDYPGHDLTKTRRSPLKNKDNNIEFGDYTGAKTSTYSDYAGVRVEPRASMKKGTTIDFGPKFYGDTSYGETYTTKKCLVPSLRTLDEYTFKGIDSGHRIYEIDCGCPPKGSCVCPPPPSVTA